MYSLNRNKWIITSAIAGIMSSSIIIVLIFSYYYNNNQTLYQHSTTNLDKFGIKEIYPTKPGGEEWFMNMQNPTLDPRFDQPMLLFSDMNNNEIKVSPCYTYGAASSCQLTTKNI